MKNIFHNQNCRSVMVQRLMSQWVCSLKTPGLFPYGNEVSKQANLFHYVICLSITLIVLFIQMDELWSFLRNKHSQLFEFVGLETPTRQLDSKVRITDRIIHRLCEYLFFIDASWNHTGLSWHNQQQLFFRHSYVRFHQHDSSLPQTTQSNTLTNAEGI